MRTFLAADAVNTIACNTNGVTANSADVAVWINLIYT